MKKLLTLAVCIAVTVCVSAQNPPVAVDVTGTLRAKFEYQPTEDNARFNVRTARFGVGGTVYDALDYKMEIDLSDEGEIKMVDAYVGGKIWRSLTFNIGYMRVPFTIDAHRSPHLQLFANRSFIAKQVGNVRDVGATLGWKFGELVPVNLQVGVFNGSGLGEDLGQYWTRHFNYSFKAQVGFARGFNLVGSYQTTRPQNVRLHLYDVGITYQSGRWLAEGEYLHKTYSDHFHPVDAFDIFAGYGLPVAGERARGALKKVSFLGRWDYMDDHSNGLFDPDAVQSFALPINDLRRHRATAGVTFSLGMPFTADIRLNYEKYFYGDRTDGLTPGPSDHDKAVVELMVHF